MAFSKLSPASFFAGLLAQSVLLLVPLSSDAAAPVTTDAVSLDHRVRRLEQMLSNRRDLDTMRQVQALHQELQNLQGQIEVAHAQIKQLKHQQRELYKDLDRRISHNTAAVPHASPASAASESHGQLALEVPRREPTAVAAQVSVEAQHKVDSPGSVPEKQLYAEAYDLINQKRYVSAEYKLREYIEQYPRGQFLPNAYYWLGEVYLLQHKPDAALNAFAEVVQHFPQHQKLGDSLLKIGYAYDAKGDVEQARLAYERVSQRFQGSALARLAEAQLAHLREIR